MGLIPKETVDQIMQTADIVEVVGDYVQLKRKGTTYSACCPFHNEKTPSFYVTPSRGIFKCFGCGKAGDAVRFVMEIDGVSYPEALKYLAKKYGVAIQEEEKTPEEQLAQNERDSQFIVSDWAKTEYHRLLLNSEEGMSVGYAYLKERGLNLTTIQHFELGYSLDQWEHLLKEAEKAGFDQKYLEKTGLVVSRTDDAGRDTGRRYDRFRGRVMFPIHNVSGRVVGFGARTLKRDDKMAKYLNSPESDIYHKSDVLYGLFQARQAIRNEELCYLVEGYLDVLSLHQGGVKNVVASSGTSLTEGQIRLIKRYSDNVTVLYDGDAAGIRASLRGIDLLLEGGLNVRVVLFPDGDDPDSYIRKVGDQRFKDHLEKASQDFISFKTSLAAQDAARDPVKKAEAIRDVLQSIAKVPDGLKRQVFLQQTSATFGIDEQVIITEYNKLVKSAEHKVRTTPPAAAEHRARPAAASENRLLTPEEEAEVALYGGPPLVEILTEGITLSAVAPTPGSEAARAAEADDDEVPNVLRSCEREILRLLILYAAYQIPGPGYTVAYYLFSQLESTPLQTPLYADVWEICRQQVQAGQLPSARELGQHPRADIRSLISDLATERYELSPNWRIKEIYVVAEHEQLQVACDNAVLRLNKCHVQRALTACLEELRAPELTDDQMMALLGRLKGLKELDNQLGNMLGTVIPRGA